LTAPDLYISAHVLIRSGVVYRDGELIFKDETAGGTNEFFLSVYRALKVDYPKFYKMDNLCKLGFLATEWLLRDRQIAEEYGVENIGIILTNANSSLDADLKYFESVKNIPSPAQFVYTLPNIVIGEVSIRHGFKGENAFFVSEDFDAGFIRFYVQDLFMRNRVQACICGWVDCLGEEYKAVLYLVEKVPGKDKLIFDLENIQKTDELANGQFNERSEAADYSTIKS